MALHPPPRVHPALRPQADGLYPGPRITPLTSTQRAALEAAQAQGPNGGTPADIVIDVAICFATPALFWLFCFLAWGGD